MIKLADFSLALFTSERATSSNCVPIRWTAPEILKGGQYSVKSDIWSFGMCCYSSKLAASKTATYINSCVLGVLLWELWTAGQEPYSGLHNQQVADLVKLVPLLVYQKTIPPHTNYWCYTGDCRAPP